MCFGWIVSLIFWTPPPKKWSHTKMKIENKIRFTCLLFFLCWCIFKRWPFSMIIFWTNFLVSEIWGIPTFSSKYMCQGLNSLYYIGFLRGCPRGWGNWRTLRIPREDWGTLGKIRGITTPGPLRILLSKGPKCQRFHQQISQPYESTIYLTTN